MTERRLRLLCLDGGGVRGLASLYLLQNLMSYVGDQKPCEFFDMICGTSTGGLIAIMLGRLEMTVKECIDAFVGVMDAAFKPKHGLFFSLSGNIQARYDTDMLEMSIKKVLKDQNYDPESLMRDPKRSLCKVIVVAMTGGARSHVLFTDYPRQGEYELYKEVKIWEAARATSAATSFFDPITISSGGVPRQFLDGGAGANNPVNELWCEAAREYGPSPLEPQIRCLLSIGTGVPPLEAFGKSLKAVGKSIIKIATETQKTANDFHNMRVDLARRDGYFRFNPPDISEVGLEDASKKGIIADRTQAYSEGPEIVEKMERFHQAVGEEQRPPQIPPVLGRAMVKSKPKRFYELGMGSDYIRPNVDSYWRHLTLESHKIYEEVYKACRGNSGNVRFTSFLEQFKEPDPSFKKIEEVWTRLLRDKTNVYSSSHPKGFVMATLYMLHVEKYLPSNKPRDENNNPGVDPERRECLRRYGNWVLCECDCQCGLRWNFANDIGLHKGGEEQKCAVAKFLDRKGFLRDIFTSKQEGFLRKTSLSWDRSRDSS